MFKTAFNLQSNLQAFTELLSLLTRHRVLTFEMARREITDRYAGQLFGIFWTFFHPLILILVYIFIFNFVFVSKVGGTLALPLDMTAYILSGIIPWLAFQDAMSKATTVITTNANLVKQVIFPIEVLPVKGVLATLFTELVFLVMLVIYTLITAKSLWITYLLLPVILFFQVLAMVGVSYILGAVGTYIRDTKDVIQVFLTLGMWFVPILYLPEAIPQAIRTILYINPFTHMIFCYQDVLYFGRFQHPWSWLIFPLLSLVVFLYGYRLFRKLKTMFGNVL
jgi:lipopolysaccharide transport system permease protein